VTRAVLARRASDERGISLIELVVTTSVLMLFSVMAFNFLTSTNSAASRATKDVQAENDVRLALRQITEDVRAADPISTSYPSSSTCPAGGTYPTGFGSCLSFTVVRNTSAGVNCPKTVVTYGLVSGTVKMDRVEYDSSCSATSTVTGKTVIANVVNPSGTNVFRYFDSAGNQLASSAPLSSYAASASVMVTLVIQYQSNASNITVSSTAALRNNRA
jgi:type II secretory pathway pseudopilin PulG